MTTNKQALREVAEKAISEEGETWWNEEQLASDYGLALHKADAKFIAAANPATVLALLDELEADELQIKTLESRNRRLEGIIEAAEKRIAELEVRSVIVPSVSDDAFWLNFNGRFVFREETYRSAVFKALDSVGIKNAAGITTKGE